MNYYGYNNRYSKEEEGDPRLALAIITLVCIIVAFAKGGIVCGLWVCGFVMALGGLYHKLDKWLTIEPPGNKGNFDRFFNRNPYQNEIDKIYNKEIDEDPEVIQMRKELKELVEANRKRNERELALEDEDRRYRRPID